LTKQQKTYVLLIVTLLVWGIIGFQIYNRLNPKQEMLAKNSIEQKYEPQKLKKVITYTITADYRDPFLGKFPATKKIVTNKKKKTTKKQHNKRFPKIIYNGIVEGRSLSFVITINGNQETLKLKETLKDITLLKGNAEEITLLFNEETKTFKQQ